MNALDQSRATAALCTLLYFDIFSYPLTAGEVHAFAGTRNGSDEETGAALSRLVAEGRVFCFDDRYYAVQNRPDWVARRLEMNRMADAMQGAAHRMAAFIGRFPFVRAVFVSGSMSKHCMQPDSDIDFFIITEPGRLWLARTMMVAFKKIFLLNSHKYFCVNYFIDTEHLEIEERNLFTATETATLLPFYGRDWYQRFWEDNHWVRDFLPNFPKRNTAGVPEAQGGGGKKMMERVLSGPLGARLDTACMALTVSFWRRKFLQMDAQVFERTIYSRKYVSKHHPLNFQRKVLDAYVERLRQWNITPPS